MHVVSAYAMSGVVVILGEEQAYSNLGQLPQNNAHYCSRQRILMLQTTTAFSKCQGLPTPKDCESRNALKTEQNDTGDIKLSPPVYRLFN